jgi:hypothetical protein
MQLTDLHLALLGVAVVLLASLFGYGKWKERQAMRKLDAEVRGGIGDPLLDRQAAPRAAAPAVDNPEAEVASSVEVTDVPMSVLRGSRLAPGLQRLDARDGAAHLTDTARLFQLAGGRLETQVELFALHFLQRGCQFVVGLDLQVRKFGLCHVHQS